MALKFYYTDPFTVGTEIVPPDFFTGDGISTDFPVTNKSIYEVASTVQYSTTQLYLYAGGFSKDVTNSEVDLSVTPPVGSQGIIPGNVALTLSSYDSADVNGVPAPANEDEKYFYLADVDEINLYGYRPREDNYGIVLTFVDAITSAGADLSFVQMACCDYTGTALTYGATATNLYTPSLDQFGTVSASGTAGANTLSCVAASTFIEGDYIFINFGNPTQEIVRFQSASGDVMTFVTNFNYDHAVDETLFATARQFSAKQIIPEGATGGTAENYINLYLSATATQYRRF